MSRATAPEHKMIPPTEPGFYWARSTGFKFWHLIVRVYGQSPYFDIDILDVRNHKLCHNCSFVDITEFGPPLHIGDMPYVEGDRKDFHPL